MTAGGPFRWREFFWSPANFFNSYHSAAFLLQMEENKGFYTALKNASEVLFSALARLPWPATTLVAARLLIFCSSEISYGLSAPSSNTRDFAFNFGARVSPKTWRKLANRADWSARPRVTMRDRQMPKPTHFTYENGFSRGEPTTGLDHPTHGLCIRYA